MEARNPNLGLVFVSKLYFSAILNLSLFFFEKWDIFVILMQVRAEKTYKFSIKIFETIQTRAWLFGIAKNDT